MPFRKYFQVFKTVFVIILLSSLFFQPASAIDAKIPVRGLTISPLRTELEIAPGRSQDQTLRLVNYSDKPMTVHLSAEKFSVTNSAYDYAFTAESDTAKWVNFTKDDVELKPGESQKVGYNLGIPLTAEPGGRYISLFASTNAVTGNEQVKSKQRIGSLIYLNVSGKVTRVGKLVSLNSPWFMSAKDSWSTSLQNSGTTHYRSRYGVEINNLFGGSVATTSNDALILPASVRSVTGTIPAPRWPGIYKAIFTIGLGDTPAVKQTKYLVYAPSWSVVALVIVIGLAVVGYYYIRSLRKPIKTN